MRYTLIKFETSKTIHVAEEIMLPFAGVIRGRILCSGLRDKNVYEHEITDYLHRLKMSREAWFVHPERIEGGTCKKCVERHNRYMDEYEAEKATWDRPTDPTELSLTLPADECVLDRSGTCVRTDDAHKNVDILPAGHKDRWWACPAHD